MAYDEGLAERVRELISESPGVTEKKMFGEAGCASTPTKFEPSAN